MRRHPSLVPLSHDHHHALVHARRLRGASAADAPARASAAAAFLRFFAAETVRHFREEEERLFPLVAQADGFPQELIVEALLEHQRLRALVAGLGAESMAHEVRGASLLELADVLERHVRLEERRLFPLIEEAVAERLRDVGPREHDPEGPVVDLTAPSGRGPVWGTQTDDLNATLLCWNAGEGPPDSANAELDLLVVVLGGAATVRIDGVDHAVRAGDALVVEKGRRRQITAGPDGVRYLTAHRRRGPLQIASLP